MSNIFDKVLEDRSPDALADTGYSFYDADTLYDKEGQGYRLKGVNAYEVDRLGKEGQVGGQLAKDEAVRLANELGYTTVVKTGEMDRTGNREMIDLQDKSGRSFANELAASGLAPIMPEFDSDGSMSTSQMHRQMMRSSDDYELSDFDKAADALKEHLKNNNEYQALFKQKRLLPGMQGDVYTDESAVFEKRGIDTRTGESTTPLSTAWDTAMIGVAEAAYGMASLVGEKTGIDYLKDVGEAGVYRKRFKIGQEGKILTDYKDVKGFGDAMQYLGNNMAMSLPYMGITAVGLLAAPATGGASLLAPVSVYTGQVWNEMGDHDGERSAGMAIGAGILQASLDAVGIGGIIKATGAPKMVMKEAVKSLMAKGMTKEQAEKRFLHATKQEIGKFLKDAGTTVKEQLRHRDLALMTLAKAGQGAGFEGATEALQESIAAIAADVGTGNVIDWRDVSDRAIQGAVAGSALGGGFGAAGGVKDAGGWVDAAWKVSLEDPKGLSRQANWSREEEDAKGYVPSHQENLSEARKLPEALEKGSDRAARHEERMKTRGFKETMKGAGNAILDFFPRATRAIFRDDVLEKSPTARKMADMYGAFINKIYNGHIYENYKHFTVTQYKNMVDDPEVIFQELNDGKPVYDRDRISLSQKFYKDIQAAQDKHGNINWDKIPEGARKEQYKKIVQQLDTLAKKMHHDQSKTNRNLGKITNYLTTFKAIDKGAVNRKREKFINLLQSEYKLSHADAKALTDEIVNNQAATVGEAMASIQGTYQPGSHKKRTFKMAQNEKFADFMEQDLMANVAESARAAARYVSYQNYIGENEHIISRMYDQMQREGLTEAEVDEIAHGMKNYLDAESGNYNRAKSDLGKRLEAVQKNFMLFSTITGLSLATVASLPELALSVLGLSNKQIFGKKGSLSSMGHEFANMLYEGMMEVGRVGSLQGKEGSTKNTTGTKMIKEVGYYAWDVGAATTTGVTETHAWHQGLLENFFKWTGLQGWTDFTRATRAAMAGDFIVENALIIMKHPKNQPKTNEVREAEDKIRNLGIDLTRDLPQVARAFKTMNLPADQKNEGILANEAKVGHIVKEAVFNFVNDAVVMPMSYNRPLIYQDPRFALFMQFQGFMSAFTANQIPKMWNNYIKNGSPSMKYNTFAVMTAMIMMGFASQYLKDLIKFGKASPYLDESEYIRRGIQSSGLLGTTERGLDFMFPIYETRTSGAADWAFETAVGESPTLSKAAQIGKGAVNIMEGETDRGLSKLGAAVAGPLRHPIKRSSDWLFDGE